MAPTSPIPNWTSPRAREVPLAWAVRHTLLQVQEAYIAMNWPMRNKGMLTKGVLSAGITYMVRKHRIARIYAPIIRVIFLPFLTAIALQKGIPIITEIGTRA